MTVSVGDLAPDFVLEDTDGRPWRLSEHLGAGAIVLVFNRGFS